MISWEFQRNLRVTVTPVSWSTSRPAAHLSARCNREILVSAPDQRLWRYYHSWPEQSYRYGTMVKIRSRDCSPATLTNFNWLFFLAKAHTDSRLSFVTCLCGIFIILRGRIPIYVFIFRLGVHNLLRFIKALISRQQIAGCYYGTEIRHSCKSKQLKCNQKGADRTCFVTAQNTPTMPHAAQISTGKPNIGASAEPNVAQ